MIYRLKTVSEGGTVMIVGCGGTGAYVAEGLCRLIGKRNLILIDHDRVERRNLTRQNFFESDLGKFKSQALAERLSRQYNRPVEYSVSPIEQLGVNWRGMITIGCVDNSLARKRLEVADRAPMGPYKSYQYYGGWYIDSGNGKNSGQVLIGNSLLNELNQAFLPNIGSCEKLPLPTIQQPALLAPDSKPSCAEDDEQSPIINRMMADLVLTFVHKLLTKTLTWMGVYVDLESGTLSTVDATPETVSRITGHTIRQLEYRPRKTREVMF